MKNRSKAAYNKWAGTYDTDPNPHILLEQDEVVNLVFPKKGDIILDAACGTGRYSKIFSDKGAEVTGVDFSKKMLEIAKNKFPTITFLQADITHTLPFSNSYFNKINCAQALKHIKNIKPTLEEFSRILKPKGKIIFSVTHPEMNWEGFKMKTNPTFTLTEHAEIHHHKFSDYFDAFISVDLKIDGIHQVPISEKIKSLLTSESYKKVKGRYEIVIFKLTKK